MKPLQPVTPSQPHSEPIPKEFLECAAGWLESLHREQKGGGMLASVASFLRFYGEPDYPQNAFQGREPSQPHSEKCPDTGGPCQLDCGTLGPCKTPSQPHDAGSFAEFSPLYEGPPPDWFCELVELLGCGCTIGDVLQAARALRSSPKTTAPDGCHGLDTLERVCFYEQDFYVLSNFSAFSLVWKGLRFDTSEAAYHFEKFNDTNILWEIRTAPSAHEAFKIAERNKRLRRSDWDSVKVGIMRDILRAKAAQHEYVRRKLLATGDRELVENSWRDDFWGWGPNRDGQNMLGKLWMEVRAELRAAAPPAHDGDADE